MGQMGRHPGVAASECSKVCSMSTRVRDYFSGPQLVSPVWTLRKDQRSAVCECWTHILGHELRLTVSADPLPRTHVCKSQEELIATQEKWRKAFEAKGWKA